MQGETLETCNAQELQYWIPHYANITSSYWISNSENLAWCISALCLQSLDTILDCSTYLHCLKLMVTRARQLLFLLSYAIKLTTHYRDLLATFASNMPYINKMEWSCYTCSAVTVTLIVANTLTYAIDHCVYNQFNNWLFNLSALITSCIDYKGPYVTQYTDT